MVLAPTLGQVRAALSVREPQLGNSCSSTGKAAAAMRHVHHLQFYMPQCMAFGTLKCLSV